MPLSDKAQATRNRILEAGTRLFYLHGYNATGLDKIIQEAGVTKGNFYYYFKSKEELALESLDWQLELTLQTLDNEVISRNDSPLDTLLGVLYFISTTQKKQHRKGHICGCYFGNFTLELSTTSPKIKDKVEGVFDQYIRLIESLLIKAKDTGEIAKHIDPATISHVILSQTEGAILLDKAHQKPEALDNSIEFIKQFLTV